MHEPDAPLRLGIVLPSGGALRWMRTLAKNAETSKLATTVFIVQAPPAQKKQAPLLRLYRALDRLVFRKDQDPCQPEAFFEILNHPALDVAALSAADELPQADVILDLADDPDLNLATPTPTFGVWRFHDPNARPAPDALQGFREMLEDLPRMNPALFVRDENGRDRLLGVSCLDTCMYSLFKNAAACAEARVELALDRLAETRRLGRLPVNEDAPPIEPPVSVGDSGGSGASPTNMDVLRLMLRLLVKIGRRMLFKRELCWYTAYRFGQPATLAPDFSSHRKIVARPGDFYADPFPIKRNGDSWIFMEEYEAATDKGRICAVKVSPDGPPSAPVKVLSSAGHLSFPFLLEWEGELYMLPENMAENVARLYRCREFPGVWEPCATLLEGKRVVDAALERIDGRWWLFANEATATGKDMDARLCLYYGDSPFGPFTPHPRNPVKIDPASARSAGRIIRLHGKLYRPGQDCRARYGEGVVFNEILEITPERYREVAAGAMAPGLAGRPEGFHTINFAGDLAVTDAFRYVNRPRFWPGGAGWPGQAGRG